MVCVRNGAFGDDDGRMMLFHAMKMMGSEDIFYKGIMIMVMRGGIFQQIPRA